MVSSSQSPESLSPADRLAAILARDAAQIDPVVQFHSLFFWEQLARWIEQIATVPAPFIIALAGPSGSGKTFIRESLVQKLAAIPHEAGYFEVSSFTQDNYYRNFEADFPHLPLSDFYDEIDFDDPEHILFRQLADDLRRFKKQPLGSLLKIPQLRFGTPTSKPTTIPQGLSFPVTPFVITEGIHAFYDPAIVPLYDLKIYVDVDEPTRRARWIERNLRENRGITDNMWNTTVRCLETHITPTLGQADLVINNNASATQVTQFLNDFADVLTAQLTTHRRQDIA